MKKVLFWVAVLPLMLCGCAKEETKTCVLTEDTGSKVTYKMNATNDKVSDFEMTYVMTTKALNIDSLYSSMSEIDDETKEMIKENFIQVLGLESDTYEGLEISVDFTDDMIVNLKVDIEKADKEILEKLGFELEEENISLKVSVEEFTEEGYVCE